MRKVTNLIAPLLKSYRYRDKPDPFKLFIKMKKDNPTRNNLNKNVLILPIRVAPVSNLFEGLYGYAMYLRGYDIHALFCNQELKKCDNATILKDNAFQCSLCNYEQKRFAETFDFLNHSLTDMIDKNKREKIRYIANNIPLSDIFNYKHDGVLIGHQIEMATIKYMLSSKINLKKNEFTIREFAYSTMISYEATKKLILQIKPEFVLMSHGVYSTWGGAIEACKKLNVRAVVWGRGYVKGNIIVDFNDSYIFECADEDNTNWENITLNDKEKKKLKEYFINKQNPKKTDDYVNYYSEKKKAKENIDLTKQRNKIKFALFPNIPWDGTTFSSSKEFPSIKDFMKITLEWFEKHKEHDLIIRAHPAEVADKYNVTQERIKEIIDEILPVLPENIIFIEPDSNITSYEVSELCDANLLFASTMGLELAYFGKTIIQTGQSMISNKGFIFEAKTKEEYYDLLNKVVKNELKMSEKMKQRVEKYAYHWIYKRHIPETIYQHKGLTFTKYNIKSSIDLAPGQNKVVDWFIDRCEDGKPFIWESDA